MADNKIIYGPVNSRRLGKSLGINLLPNNSKYCNFNCKYCVFGCSTDEYEKKIALPSTEVILPALEDALLNLCESIDFITFSGNGEPTLHPDFPEIVREVIKLRDKYLPHVSTAILSNASNLHRPKILETLNLIDEKIMKLDAGDESSFRTFNQPSNGTDFSVMVDNLCNLHDATIQSLFTSGPNGNYTADNVDKWLDLLRRISPVYVQIYTVNGNTKDDNISRVDTQALKSIQQMVLRENINCTVY